VRLVFYSSKFCDPCIATRAVIGEAARLVPAAEVVERDVVRDEAAAEADGIRSTPTVIVTRADGHEVARAEGVPTLNHLLVALAKAV
jgi:hypothetical protein